MHMHEQSTQGRVLADGSQHDSRRVQANREQASGRGAEKDERVMIVDENRYESKYYIVNMETGEKNRIQLWSA